MISCLIFFHPLPVCVFVLPISALFSLFVVDTSWHKLNCCVYSDRSTGLLAEPLHSLRAILSMVCLLFSARMWCCFNMYIYICMHTTWAIGQQGRMSGGPAVVVRSVSCIYVYIKHWTSSFKIHLLRTLGFLFKGSRLSATEPDGFNVYIRHVVLQYVTRLN